MEKPAQAPVHILPSATTLLTAETSQCSKTRIQKTHKNQVPNGYGFLMKGNNTDHQQNEDLPSALLFEIPWSPCIEEFEMLWMGDILE